MKKSDNDQPGSGPIATYKVYTTCERIAKIPDGKITFHVEVQDGFWVENITLSEGTVHVYIHLRSEESEECEAQNHINVSSIYQFTNFSKKMEYGDSGGQINVEVHHDYLHGIGAMNHKATHVIIDPRG